MIGARPYARGHDAGLNGMAPALFCPWLERAPYLLGYLIGRRRLRKCCAVMAKGIAEVPIQIHHISYNDDGCALD